MVREIVYDEEINNDIEKFICMGRWEIYWDQYF